MKVERGSLSPDSLNLINEVLSLSLPDGTIGVSGHRQNGELAVVVAFSQPQHGNSFLHIASAKRHWAQVEFVEGVFDFAFRDLGLLRITAQSDYADVRFARLLWNLGFSVEAVLKGFDFGKLCMWRMMKEECKWVN